MTQSELKAILDAHKKWLSGDPEGIQADLQGANLRGADLREADLREAYLQRADLRGADLREADIDFACWPLWCGGLHVQTDARIMRQLAYHFCAQECDDPEYIHYRNLLLPFANHFSWVDECGKLEPIEEDAPC